MTTDTAVENQIIVEDVVTALTGEVNDADSNDALRTRMERAAAEFDKRTADAFGRALLDSLCEDPGNLRQLEALLILGLAHPDVLTKHRISLAVEGRRLAVLLERSGEVDRARGVLELLANRMPDERTIDHELAGILRRSGNTDELVDRYLSRAEIAVAEGNVSEAIPWLQEILLLDRTRRDVARMIRDLRYQEADRETRARRRNRFLVIVMIFAAVLTAFVGREFQIKKKYEALVIADEAKPETLYQRKEGIEALIASHKVWVGLFNATGERDELTTRIAEHEREAMHAAEREMEKEVRLTEMAEAARMRGLMYSEKGEFEEALRNFQRALEISSPDWEHRTRLEADVKALEDWKANR